MSLLPMSGARGSDSDNDRARQMTAWQKAKEALWGLFFFDYWREIVSAQKKYEDAVNLILFGEILGLPFLRTVFTLKLLPYLFKDIPPWKIRTLREYDIFEAAPDLH